MLVNLIFSFVRPLSARFMEGAIDDCVPIPDQPLSKKISFGPL
jgi:hypothetical protein